MFSVYINILTRYSQTPWFISGHWFCVGFESFSHTSIVYIGGFSIFVAAKKYWFIVHNARAVKFGQRKAKKILFISHLLLPIILALLNAISNGKIDQIFWVDHCWSHETDTKNITSSAAGHIGDYFCANRHYELPEFFGESLRTLVTNSLRATCGTVKVFYFLFLSNILELFLYLLIFRYLNR
jgi:hypothetical protein